MKIEINDFTEGKILRHLIVFSLPLLWGNFLQVFYNAVDSFWVGKFLGPQALAAVAVSFPLIFALVSLMVGISSATTTLVSQYFGANREADLKRVVYTSFSLSLVIGVLLTILGVVFRKPLLYLVNVPSDIFSFAELYFNIYLLGIVPSFLYNESSAVLIGFGNSKTPVKILGYSTLLNMLLDPIFIFGLGFIPPMGIGGAAIATVISQIFSAVLSINCILKEGILIFDFDRGFMDFNKAKLIFKVGLPVGIQNLAISLGHVFLNALVNLFGSNVIAGFAAGIRISSFAILPAMSIGAAVTSLVGQNLGAGKENRVKEVVKWGCILGGGISFCIAVIALAFSRGLVSLFTNDLRVIGEGISFLRYDALGYVPFAIIFVLGGVFRGAGDTLAAMIMTFISMWGVRVPLAAYLSLRTSMGVKGVWIAMPLGALTGLILQLYYYKLGLWKRCVVAVRNNESNFNIEGKHG